jgi:Spy/CpxP family protein refolding chaperone
MTRAFFILFLGLVVGAIAFFGMREGPPHVSVTRAHDGNSRLPELAWLKRELKLTDEQFAQVAKAHEAYRPTCEQLCARVMASHVRVKELASPAGPVTPELEAALTEHALLHVECQKAMLNHLHQTASLMSPGQAQKYLDALLPEVIELPLEPGNEAHAHHP